MAGLGLGLGLARSTGGSSAPVPGYDVFVLAGQSNMIGRSGPIDAGLDATDADIFQWGYNAQSVSLAANPLDHDGETANTIGLGLNFAKAYKAAGLLGASRQILLVPVARGGQAISYWASGSGGNTAVTNSVNNAMATGSGTNRLKGILWHQGESDNARTEVAYAADLDDLISRWRSTFTGGTVFTPFVVGEMLQGGAQTAAPITAALTDTPNRVSYTEFVNSTSLVSNGDNLHFDAASTRTFGTRYFSGYQAALANVGTPPTLGTLSLSDVNYVESTSENGTIIGATAGSTITSGSLPTGFTINGGARTWAWDGTGAAGTPSITLTETLAGASNTPNATIIGLTITTAPPPSTNALQMNGDDLEMNGETLTFGV